MSNTDNPFSEKTIPAARLPTRWDGHNAQRQIAERVGVSTGKVGEAKVVCREAPDLYQKAEAGAVARGHTQGGKPET